MFRGINNLLVLAEVIIRYAIPPWRWGETWRELQYQHLLDVRKAVWELKKQGRVREDSDGKLYLNDEKGDR